MTSQLSLSLLLLLQLPAAMIAVSVRSEKPESRFIPSEICYHSIGCFSTGGNFYDITIRPIQLVPQSPERIGVTYALYTRNNVLSAQYIVYNNRQSVLSSNFDSSKPLKVIIHGFLEDAEEQWMHDMKKALLLHGDYNVVLLDWSNGNQLPYTQATANTRVAGAVLAQLLQWLETEFGVSRSRVHLIGHSLGAHISGYAGERLRGLARITGLDPAGPYFEGTHEEVRLDPSDAEFVDAIHTDGDSLLSSIKLDGGFGLMQPVGHVDFYPNGGKKQPDCNTNPILNIIIQGIIEGTKWTVACHHLRVLPLMTSTILHKQGDFKAVPCDSYENFKAGRCATCGTGGCSQMGMSADKWKPNGKQNVKMFLDTSGEDPFQVHHYVVKVTLSLLSSAKKQYGDLSLVVEGSDGQSTELSLVEKDYMEKGAVVGAAATADKLIKNVRKVRLTWRHRWWFSVSTQYLHVNKIEVFEVFTEKRSLYCANDATVKSGDSISLSSSNACFSG